MQVSTLQDSLVYLEQKQQQTYINIVLINEHGQSDQHTPRCQQILIQNSLLLEDPFTENSRNVTNDVSKFESNRGWQIYYRYNIILIGYFAGKRSIW